jgi:predicted acylesterase/phospholipase RssA
LERLEALWKDLQLETPFGRDLDLGWPGLSSFAPARDLALFGLPGFYRPRIDVWNFQLWTSLYDTSPLAATLTKHVNFDAIKSSETTFVVTAVDVVAGTLQRFRNRQAKAADPNIDKVVDFTPDHVLASGSLAPQFPWTKIEGKQYWDGGIVDNTPLGDALDAFCDDEGVYRLLVVMNLFPLKVDKLPENLLGVTERVQELSYGNRLRQDQASAKRINALVSTIEQLCTELTKANVTLQGELKTLVQTERQYKIATSVEVELRGGGVSEMSNAARDFSPEMLERRRGIGRARAHAALRPILEAENFLAALGQPAAELTES